MKKMMILMMALAAAALSSSVYATGPGTDPALCGMRCIGYTNLTPEDQKKADQFRLETAALRRQIREGRATLRSLSSAQRPDEHALAVKQDEVAALQEQLRRKASDAGLPSSCGQAGGMGRIGGRGKMRGAAL